MGSTSSRMETVLELAELGVWDGLRGRSPNTVAMATKNTNTTNIFNILQNQEMNAVESGLVVHVYTYSIRW